MSDDLFRKLSAIIYDTCGIKLGESKATLLSARVGKRIHHLKLNSYQEYYDLIRLDNSGQELGELVNVVTTNVSQFFRLKSHYDMMVSHLKTRVGDGEDSFKIWCAACASGEEPYSAAMSILAECDPVPAVRILATDISSSIINTAKKATYPVKSLERVPASCRSFFNEVHSDQAVLYEVTQEVKDLVTFSQINLAYPPFRLKGPFEVIFCSNVMIYFDDAVRTRLLDALFHLLAPGGLLMVGSAEGLAGLIGPFEPVQPSIYRRPEKQP